MFLNFCSPLKNVLLKVVVVGGINSCEGYDVTGSHFIRGRRLRPTARGRGTSHPHWWRRACYPPLRSVQKNPFSKRFPTTSSPLDVTIYPTGYNFIRSSTTHSPTEIKFSPLYFNIVSLLKKYGNGFKTWLCNKDKDIYV